MRRLLVIDDNPDMRELMRVIFERAGYEVELASDGKAGLAAQRARPADVVVTDIFMPKRDGLETIERLRRDHPKARIVAVSGGGARLRGPSYLVTAREAGAHAALAKPFEQAELLRAIEGVLASPT